jgi:hypothetical protein
MNLSLSLAKKVADKDHIELYFFAPGAYDILIGRQFFVDRMKGLEIASRTAECIQCWNEIAYKQRDDSCKGTSGIGEHASGQFECSDVLVTRSLCNARERVASHLRAIGLDLTSRAGKELSVVLGRTRLNSTGQQLRMVSMSALGDQVSCIHCITN